MRLALLLATMTALSACASKGPPVSYRFTLTLRDGGATYTGFNVVQITPEVDLNLSSQKSYSANLRGTATFVKLPNGRLAAALLGEWGRDNMQEPTLYLDGGLGPIHLNRNQQPTIIIFANPAVPSSFEALQVAAYPNDDLHDVEVVNAKVALTREPPTMALPTELSWVRKLRSTSSNIIDDSLDCRIAQYCVRKKRLISGE